jgi:hypothetical protein
VTRFFLIAYLFCLFFLVSGCTNSNQLGGALSSTLASGNGTTSFPPVSNPTPNPTPVGTTAGITNIDSGLNLGVSGSLGCSDNTCIIGQVNHALNYTISNSSGIPLWGLGLGNFNVKAATGSMTSSYNPSSGVSWNVNFTSENAAIDGVSAYPFMSYGTSYYGNLPIDQGPVFPELLSNMSSLVVDVNYSMNCTACGAFYDVMFDLTLVPDDTETGSVSQEVSIFDFNSAEKCFSPVLSTLNQTITVNGVATPITWDICKSGTQIVVTPSGSAGFVSGDVSFDQMPILNAVAALNGNVGWYLSGQVIGTEFQATGGALNFTFNITKYSITQILK